MCALTDRVSARARVCVCACPVLSCPVSTSCARVKQHECVTSLNWNSVSTALLFSATFRKKIERLARDILVDPIRVVQGDIGEVRPPRTLNTSPLLRCRGNDMQKVVCAPPVNPCLLAEGSFEQGQGYVHKVENPDSALVHLDLLIGIIF